MLGSIEEHLKMDYGNATPAPEEKEEAEKEDFIATIKMLGNKKMQHLLPLATTRGYLMASQASVYVNFWVSCLSHDSRYSHLSEDEKMEQTLYVFAAFGIGAVVGAGMIG